MGKLKFISLCCLIFATTSCERLFNTDNVGQPVQFGTTLSSSTPKTRTSYSGVVDGNTERIHWSDGDQVSIYMDWDENRDGTGYTGKPEYGVYNVNPGSNFHPNDMRYGRISYANDGEALKWHGDFSEGDGRAHEYPHTFYSAYPPTALINGEFIFGLPSSQNGSMKNAYMASYEEGVFSNTSGADGHVELHYYPMITTFCLSIQNDLDEPIEKITLKSDSDSKKLTGNYSVSVKSDGRFGFNNYKGNNSGEVIRTVNVGSGKTEKDILLFIIPQHFEANELYFLLNSSETKRYIPSSIEAYYKYNINITVSKEEPEVDGRMSDAVAQMLAMAIRHWINDQNGVYDLLKDCYDVNPPEGKNNWFSKNIWGSFCNLTDTEGTFKNLTYQDLVDVFESEEAVDLLLNFLRQKSYERGEVNITASPKICTSLNGTELASLFPGATTIYLQVSQNIVDSENPIHIDVEGFDYLTTVTIEYAQSVSFNNCPNLVTATIRNKASNYKGYTVSECPKLTVKVE